MSFKIAMLLAISVILLGAILIIQIKLALLNLYPTGFINPRMSGAGYLESGNLMIGVKGKMSLLNPLVDENQEASSMVGVVHYDPISRTSYQIEAGWMVSPRRYGDSKTRFNTDWLTINNEGPYGCCNEDCPGFVHVNKSFSLGQEFSEVSTYDGNQKSITVAIVQDQSTKDWWLWLTVSTGTMKVGYWPNELVPGLKDGAKNVFWGGSTLKNLAGKSPPMGYGKFPDGNSTHSGSFAECRVVEKEGKESAPKNPVVKVYNNLCFKIRASGDAFLYGGPGGDC